MFKLGKKMKYTVKKDLWSLFIDRKNLQILRMEKIHELVASRLVHMYNAWLVNVNRESE